uniref:RING-type domain-containing protein n=1 Tax=Globodera rostochiensis TaxID=31243 RepID=A0A914IB25_GLORO
MIVNLLLIFIFLNQFIEIKAGNNGFFRRKRDAPASNSSRQEERPILNNINSNSFPNDVNDVSASLQHLQTNEAEQPSQNSHVQPEESHGISQVAQTTATINSRVGLRPPNPDIVNPDPDFSAPEGDHPMPGIDNIEMPQGQASSSSDLASDGSNNKECAICLQPLLASEDVKKLLSCQHTFHPNCIDTWLGIGKTTCPVCRCQVNPIDRVGRVEPVVWGC